MEQQPNKHGEDTSRGVNVSAADDTLGEFLVGYGAADVNVSSPAVNVTDTGGTQTGPQPTAPAVKGTLMHQSQQMYMAMSVNGGSVDGEGASGSGHMVLVPVNQVALPDGRLGFQIQSHVPALSFAPHEAATTSSNTISVSSGENVASSSADSSAAIQVSAAPPDDVPTTSVTSVVDTIKDTELRYKTSGAKTKAESAARRKAAVNASRAKAVSVGTHRVEMADEQQVTLEYTSQYRYDHLGNKVPLYQCTLCQYWSHKRYCVVRHMKSHSSVRPLACDMCSARFKTAAALRSHTDTHSQTRRFQCSECVYRATTSGELNRHVRYKHLKPENRPHKCPLCDFAAVELSKLRRHMRVHSGERPYKCRYCEYAAIDKPRLDRHERTHTGDKPFKCDICAQSFVQGVTMRAHRETHFALSERRTFACDVCGKKLTRQADLRAHDRRMHQPTPGLACRICGINVADKWTLRQHKRTHGRSDRRRRFRCSLCGHWARSKMALDQHSETHLSKNSYQCRRCDRTFTQRPQLLRHMRQHDATHTVLPKAKRFTCPLCNRKFHFERNYERHMCLHRVGVLNTRTGKRNSNNNRIRANYAAIRALTAAARARDIASAKRAAELGVDEEELLTSLEPNIDSANFVGVKWVEKKHIDDKEDAVIRAKPKVEIKSEVAVLSESHEPQSIADTVQEVVDKMHVEQRSKLIRTSFGFSIPASCDSVRNRDTDCNLADSSDLAALGADLSVGSPPDRIDSVSPRLNSPSREAATLHVDSSVIHDIIDDHEVAHPVAHDADGFPVVHDA